MSLGTLLEAHANANCSSSHLLLSLPCLHSHCFPHALNTMPSTRRFRALQRSVDHFAWHALPRELKLHVLRHLLPECEYDETISRSTKDSRKQPQSVTSLLCIDRETFNTLAPTAYSQRIVVFCNPLHLANGLLDRCSAAFLTNLRYLIFHLEYPSQDTEAQLEKMLKVLSVSQELRSTLHCLTIM